MPSSLYTLSREFLNLIANNIPATLQTYLTCVDYSDSKGHLYISKKMIEEEAWLSWTKFCNDLHTLARLGLLNFIRTNEGKSFIIDITIEQDYLTGESLNGYTS